MAAIDSYLSHVGVVLTWEDLHESRSSLDEIRETIRGMHAYTLLVYACHWNALVSPADQVFDPEVQGSILGMLCPPDQLAAIREVVHTKPNVGAWDV